MSRPSKLAVYPTGHPVALALVAIAHAIAGGTDVLPRRSDAEVGVSVPVEVAADEGPAQEPIRRRCHREPRRGPVEVLRGRRDVLEPMARSL